MKESEISISAHIKSIFHPKKCNYTHHLLTLCCSKPVWLSFLLQNTIEDILKNVNPTGLVTIGFHWIETDITKKTVETFHKISSFVFRIKKAIQVWWQNFNFRVKASILCYGRSLQSQKHFLCAYLDAPQHSWALFSGNWSGQGKGMINQPYAWWKQDLKDRKMHGWPSNHMTSHWEDEGCHMSFSSPVSSVRYYPVKEHLLDDKQRLIMTWLVNFMLIFCLISPTVTQSHPQGSWVSPIRASIYGWISSGPPSKGPALLRAKSHSTGNKLCYNQVFQVYAALKGLKFITVMK